VLVCTTLSICCHTDVMQRTMDVVQHTNRLCQAQSESFLLLVTARLFFPLSLHTYCSLPTAYLNASDLNTPPAHLRDASPPVTENLRYHLHTAASYSDYDRFTTGSPMVSVLIRARELREPIVHTLLSNSSLIAQTEIKVWYA